MIRAATEADAAAVAALVDRAFAGWAAAMERTPRPMLADYRALTRAGAVWVAEEAAAIVGVLVLEPHADHLLVETVAVDPSLQGRGLGRALMTHAEAQAHRLSLDLLRLYTNAAMTGNVPLYRRLGYVETHCAVKDGRHLVFMEKRLSRQPSPAPLPGGEGLRSPSPACGRGPG